MVDKMRKFESLLLISGLTILFLAIYVIPANADEEVTIVDFSFMPATVTIQEGESVTWTNVDQAPHTSTSDDGIWDSGSLSHGESFTYTFDEPGTYPYTCTFHPMMTGTVEVMEVTGVSEGEGQLPKAVELYQNYPNPFNAQTNIEFDIPFEGNVSLEVYNIVGQQVAIPVDDNLSAGNHTVTVDVTDNPSGVYFYRLKFDDQTITRKMNLIK